MFKHAFVLLSILAYSHAKQSKFFFSQSNAGQFDSNFSNATLDITRSFPSSSLTIVFDNSLSTDIEHLITTMSVTLSSNFITVNIFNITNEESQEQYFSYIYKSYINFIDVYLLHICSSKMMEHVLLEIQDRNYIRKNLIYIFYWGNKTVSRYFIRSMNRFSKLVVLTNPRKNVFRVYFNQGLSHKKHHLSLVNWWIYGIGLYQYPTVPPATHIYKNFNGRTILVPVIHKPPWHFVHYTNTSFKVVGGRDDKLLKLLSKTLNFRFKYIDPPKRIQGTLFENGSGDGVLGLLYNREVEFFLGDVAITILRVNIVDFTYFTLADSGAFVTHSPSKLNEALALIRPFQKEVWPLIAVLVVVFGPILYFMIAIPNRWKNRSSQKSLFQDCIWLTITLFFRQNSKQVSRSHKARYLIIIMSISATYIISDIYSANLTSLLAKPGREKPIRTLEQLEEAVSSRGYTLLVEKFSSIYSLLQNGTGIYGKLWNTTNKTKKMVLIESVEFAVNLVKNSKTVALIAGRETLFFDIRRFGPQHFQLSEKLNTGYSAIACQIGCPYIENFNKIIMAIFEAGILNKMTEREYEKLGQQASEAHLENLNQNIENKGTSLKIQEENERLTPLRIKMLQGAFYVLIIGYLIAFFCLLGENICFKNLKNFNLKPDIRIWNHLKRKIIIFKKRITNYVRNYINHPEANSFEYLD